MSTSVLEKIVANKKRELVLRKTIKPLAEIKASLKSSDRSLYGALRQPGAGYIFECKKASPSRGLINRDFKLQEISEVYSRYAHAISVLTDNKFFKGSFAHLKKVKRLVKQPILCKDFFIDPYQVYEARYFGADAILLMLSVVNDEQYKQLAEIAERLNLDVLTEVHDEQEMQRALLLDAKIIGVNNRNLNDLSIDLITTKNLMANLSEQDKKGRLFISESGISNHQQVKKLAPMVDGFLIGSSIMQNSEIEAQCKALIYGKVKICGITSAEIAKIAHEKGATYGGLIFAPESIRKVELERAIEITKAAPLTFVGVFVNETIEKITSVVKQLSLPIVQLHGDEDDRYIQKLKTQLPNVYIWKAKGIHNKISQQQIKDIQEQNQRISLKELPTIDRLLLDSANGDKRGGNGTCFDWNSLTNGVTEHLVLAGGLSPDNIKAAASLGAFALDVNSGVESVKGTKSTEKIEALFDRLRI